MAAARCGKLITCSERLLEGSSEYQVIHEICSSCSDFVLIIIGVVIIHKFDEDEFASRGSSQRRDCHYHSLLALAHSSPEELLPQLMEAAE